LSLTLVHRLAIGGSVRIVATVRSGEKVPDAIKNQPWNIKPMPRAEVHGRITGPYKGKPQFNALERYWYGTPAWSKVATGAAVGHPAAAANAQAEKKR